MLLLFVIICCYVLLSVVVVFVVVVVVVVVVAADSVDVALAAGVDAGVFVDVALVLVVVRHFRRFCSCLCS